MSKEHLEEFEVILYPKPFITTVMANFPWQAIKIAEDNYGSGDVTGYGFDKFEIKAKGESQKQ